jgi:hypothetical protein
VIAALVIGAAVSSAFLAAAAAAARMTSLASLLCVAYLAYVVNVGLVTLALSPFRDVTRGGLAVTESILVAGALTLWWARGRPGVPLAAARRAARDVVTDPASALFLAVVVVLLGYELLLGLDTPVIRWDSLTYHLARAAAWAEHGGIYWIANAPDVRMNAFQPLAEQQILFLFATTGTGTLSALPQYVAELAILIATYGGARRLGFGVRPAACSAFLIATFSLVAFEASTADNDLVAASLVAVAMCLLLGDGLLEPALAGVAVGCGVGVKLTTVLVLPVIVWLALARGRRTGLAALAGASAGFVAIGMWGYVLNLVNTGHVFGVGTGALEDRASPGYPRSLANAFYYLYGAMDLSDLSDRMVEWIAVAGLVVAATTATLGRARPRRALLDAASVATPFLAPLLVVGGGGGIAFLAARMGFPIRGPRGILAPLDGGLDEVYTRIDNENYAAFGPLGIVAIVAAIVLTVRAVAARRVDARRLALACALPSFLVFMSLGTSWSPYLTRFFLVPLVLTAPLLASLFRGRATTAAYLVVASLAIGLTLVHDQAAPLQSTDGPPWRLTQAQAFDVDFAPYLGDAVTAYDALVPPRACVGAVLGANEPAYLLFGPGLAHHVVFLPTTDALAGAYRAGLYYVVITTQPESWSPAVTGQFEAAGWRLSSLAGYWLLASAPRAGSGACSRAAT